ncbi:MAG: DUF1194 domain-containing protein [Pseudomonadota bacterium]
MIRQMTLAACVALGLAGPATAFDCHMAIVFALDASRSVDATESRIQREGLADALRDPVIQSYILPYPGSGIAAMAFEWANPEDQLTIAPWAILDSPEAIAGFATRLEVAPTIPRRLKTGIGAALRFAGAAHRAAPVSCRRQVVDMSGDGPGNAGVLPRTIRRKGELDGLTINGLVIRHPNLDSAQPPDRDPLAYYNRHIIQGPGAFVMDIAVFDDYPAAIRRKLLRELSPSLAQR